MMNVTGMSKFPNSGVFSVGGESVQDDYTKRMTDGTCERELLKAMSTYLSKPGAADYNLPKMTGEKIMLSNKRNMPTWNLHSKTKLTWFPGRDVEFAGSASPAANKYSPSADKPF